MGSLRPVARDDPCDGANDTLMSTLSREDPNDALRFTFHTHRRHCLACDNFDWCSGCGARRRRRRNHCARLDRQNRSQEEKAGQVLNNAKLAPEGKGLQVTTGPAVTYWNPANKAAGQLHREGDVQRANYMSLNNHPHPYGIVIGGNDMGTDATELPVLRRLRQRQLHRSRLRPGAVPDERPRGRSERRGQKGRRQGIAGDAGDRRLGQGRQGRVRHQRHRRRQLRQGRRWSPPASSSRPTASTASASPTTPMRSSRA